MGIGGALTSITGILVPYMVGVATPNVSIATNTATTAIAIALEFNDKKRIRPQYHFA